MKPRKTQKKEVMNRQIKKKRKQNSVFVFFFVLRPAHTVRADRRAESAQGRAGKAEEERENDPRRQIRSCERHAPVCLCVDVCTYIRIYNKAHRCCRHTGKRSTACVATHTATQQQRTQQTRCSHVSPPPHLPRFAPIYSHHPSWRTHAHTLRRSTSLPGSAHPAFHIG
jgi:hypothetical protein